MRILHTLTALAALALTMGATGATAATPHNIIPLPRAIKTTGESFRIPGRPLTYSAKGCEPIIDSLLSKYAVKTNGPKADIRIDRKLLKRLGMHGYSLDVNKKGVTITGADNEGVLYCLQSLIQLLDEARKDSVIDGCQITDSPLFPYRGMHVDVSRHFRSIDFLKKQIDAMTLLKMNNMHLHLTDAAGWRIDIPKYPRLAQYAAWRPEKTWSDWAANGARYCESTAPGAYGGFYTADQLRDLVDYAAKRHINVIPEIEMPGHSEELVAAYPEISCRRDGTGSDVCPGKEETFTILQNILDEVMDIFPSQLIHIGGDEAGKAHWKTCPDCQKRMEAEGLKDLNELQSYLISRIEKYVNSKGRTIVGWDEILEGGLAPNATVMSWRGTEGGIKAIQQNHDVVMTPGGYTYFDHCQDASFKEPLSIGGYIPLSKVYSWQPFDGIPEGEGRKHLLGVQACLWSEYVTDDSHAEYMYYPRTFAISEIGWSNPEKDYDNFAKRAQLLNSNFKNRGYSHFDLTSEYGERQESQSLVNHLARGARVTYAKPYTNVYPAGGDTALTDGIRGGWTYGDKKWQGWFTDLDLTVDLGAEKEIHYVNATFMHSAGPQVYLPATVRILTSTDGINFTPEATLRTDLDPKYPKIAFKDFGTPISKKVRYVRIQADRDPLLQGCLFTDEIVIN